VSGRSGRRLLIDACGSFRDAGGPAATPQQRDTVADPQVQAADTIQIKGRACAARENHNTGGARCRRPEEPRGAAMTQLPHTFKRIRMNLARSKAFPLGSARHGYEFVAPLRPDGHIDAELWHKHRDRCRVRRFWGEDEEIGRLVHKPGGKEHARWVFDYDQTAETDDEAGYRFGAHAFEPGEYVSIRDEDGELHTFQVVTVEAAG